MTESPVGSPDPPSASAGATGAAAWTKRLIESAIVTTGICRLTRHRHRSGASILAYHNIIPDDVGSVGDRSLHLPRSAFARQLDRLARTHEIVPLDRILEPAGRTFAPSPDARTNRPSAAITFDDAYRGAMTIGLDELAARGWPATVFVAPGLLGDREAWWDVLADPRLGAPLPEVRERALNDARGMQEAVLPLIGNPRERQRMPAFARIVTEGELLDAVARHVLDVGSHTWSHANLTRLDETEVEREYVRARDWLSARFDRFVPWLAYPYGLSSRLAEGLAASTYRAGLRLGGGYAATAPKGGDRYRVPRINVPSGVSDAGFELRAAGLIRR